MTNDGGPRRNLVLAERSKLTASLQALHVPNAAQVAARVSQSQGGQSVSSIPRYYSLDFAHATQSVLFVMCGIMAFAGVVALFGLQRGLQDAATTTTGGTATTTGAGPVG
jgi:hypothetical protein